MLDVPAIPTYTRDEVYEASLRYFKGDKLPTGVFVDKYALRNRDGLYLERTPDDMHRRLAREFARVEARYPNPLTEEEIYTLLQGFRGIVPQGSPMFGIGNDYQLVSLSNCAVVASPEDTMSSILHTARDLSNLYKRRFGAGVDISGLRPQGAAVNNAAITSTGAWSFADLYSYVTRMVGQSGRRGALMITMDVRHPDIERFITMKADLTKVTGANVSVKVTDEFMEAVERDEDFMLRFPVDATPDTARSYRFVKARELFSLIAEQAHSNGEPGFLFWDTITRNLPLDFYKDFRTISTNPCGEIPLCAHDSCRLISIYLADFVGSEFTDHAYFDFWRFQETVKKAMRLSDDMIDLEIEKLVAVRNASDTEDERALFDEFIRKAREGRRTGLGTHGLADALARLQLRYDSDEALHWIDKIYTTLKDAAYAESVALAVERGPFPAWDWETEKNCEFFRGLASITREDMQVHGRRNGAILTNAPTGSVSIVSENCSSGIEPVFLNEYTRRRKVDPNTYTGDVSLLERDATGDYWESYAVYHSNLQRYKTLAQQGVLEGGRYQGARLEDIPTPEYFVTSAEIDWMQRIKVQGTIQKHLDHSISSTINLPRDVPVDTVSDLYFAAWRAGCKGATIYRDGSREAQVLSGTPEKKSTEQEQNLDKTLQALEAEVARLTQELAERESSCPARPHRGLTTEGKKYKAAFRDLNGKERKAYVYVGLNEEGEVVEVFVDDTKGGKETGAYAEAMGRLISLALKEGVAPRLIADTLYGIEGGSISYSGGVFKSVPDLVAKRMYVELESQQREAYLSFSSQNHQYGVIGNLTGTGELTLSTGMSGMPSVTITPTTLDMDLCDQCGEIAVPRLRGSCPPCRECGYSKCS